MSNLSQNNMIYIIKSNSYRLLKDKINSITDSIGKDSIVNYDLTLDNFKDILNESNNKSLFDTKKVSIIYNSNIFDKDSSESESLSSYIKDDNNIFIFVVDNYSIKNTTVKKVKESNCLFDITMPVKDELTKNINEYIRNSNYKIDNKALFNLIGRCNNNYDYILNELDKLFIVKENNIITDEDIIKYTNYEKIIDIFDIVDKIIKKKADLVLKDFNLIINNIEPSVLLSNVATQYRLIYSTNNLIKDGLSESTIANKLGIHPYRIKLAHENFAYYTNKELEKKLLYIGELDKKIKEGVLDKTNALKILLLNI